MLRQLTRLCLNRPCPRKTNVVFSIGKTRPAHLHNLLAWEVNTELKLLYTNWSNSVGCVVVGGGCRVNWQAIMFRYTCMYVLTRRVLWIMHGVAPSTPEAINPPRPSRFTIKAVDAYSARATAPFFVTFAAVKKRWCLEGVSVKMRRGKMLGAHTQEQASASYKSYFTSEEISEWMMISLMKTRKVCAKRRDTTWCSFSFTSLQRRCRSRW